MTFLELKHERGTSLHAVNPGCNELLADDPGLFEHVPLIDERRVLTTAALACRGFIITPIQRKKAALAKLALDMRALYIVTFTYSVGPPSEPHGVEIRGLPLEQYDRVEQKGVLVNTQTHAFLGNRDIVTVATGKSLGPTRIEPGYFLICCAGEI